MIALKTIIFIFRLGFASSFIDNQIEITIDCHTSCHFNTKVCFVTAKIFEVFEPRAIDLLFLIERVL